MIPGRRTDGRVALGAAAGILLAPNSGRKTRTKILDESNKFRKQLIDAIEEAFSSMKDNYNKKVDDYATNGKRSIDVIREKVKV